jgi:hypothetical protein
MVELGYFFIVLLFGNNMYMVVLVNKLPYYLHITLIKSPPYFPHNLPNMRSRRTFPILLIIF